MRKLIFCLLFLTLAGCESVKELKVEEAGQQYCINGHLYLRYHGLVPLFDYRTDIPTLIQCKQVGDKIEFESDKLIK